MPDSSFPRTPRRIKAPDALGPVTRLGQRPTFAVVTAAYQSAEFIAANVETVLGGTLAPDEYIICDDGSTDDIEDALAPFADRVTLIRKENGGPASAYNVAVRAARSDFVVQTDHDDTFSPERLEAMAQLAVERPDLDLIATDAVMELEGVPVGRYNELNPFRVDDQRAAVLDFCFFGWPAIRRERLLAVGGFDESLRIAFDWDCWIRLILSGCRVGLIEEPLYRFRLVRGSVSSSTARNLREDLIVLDRLRGDEQLSDAERSIVEGGISERTRYLAFVDAREALIGGRSDARRLLLRVASGSDQPVRSRVKAGISAVAPNMARRVLLRRMAASPTGGINLHER